VRKAEMESEKTMVGTLLFRKRESKARRIMWHCVD
jgi:hypothetical protein